MAGPDLTPARTAIENLMDDTCTITLDAEGTRDDVLNQATGLLQPQAPDSEVVYRGKCKVRGPGTSSVDNKAIREGGATAVAEAYVISIPIGAAEPAIGSVVTVNSSRRDPGLVGSEFRVRSVTYSTFSVQRKLTCELRTTVTT